MKPKMTQEEKEISKAFNIYWKTHFSRGNGAFEMVISLWHPDITAFGTGKDEIVKTYNEFKKFVTREFQEVNTSMPVKILWKKINPLKNEALVLGEVEVTVSAENNIKMRFRVSSIFKKHKSKWLLYHIHGSLPASEQRENESFPIDGLLARKEELEKEVAEKTADLLKKNKELEIEAALEKVRVVAMGMKEPADMLDVCRIISAQLQSLGVKEIRNVQTAIFYEQRCTYMNYEYYAKHDKTVITETSFTNHEMHKEFAAKMLKGKGETFITHIKDNEINEWIAYQKTTNVFIDKYLETASSLNYYWFSLGPVALGISTYHPFIEEETNLFKRFLKVFELAYRRYLDIEKAEGQARETEIELALERVRARTMAMQKSEELSDVVMILFGQMKDLDIDIDGININILNEGQTGFDSWFTAPGYTKAVCLYTPYFDTPVMNDIFNAVKSKQDLLSKIYPKEEKDAYFTYLYEHSDYKNLPDERKKMILGAAGWCLSVGIANNIGISIHSYTERTFTEKEHDILKRFAKVFEQTYTRFLDLQKAEAQAREAKIETALEKIRAAAMSMRKPDDLLNICEVLYKELHNLSFSELRNAMINIHNDDNKTFFNYDYSDEIGKSLTLLNYNSHPVMEKQIKQSRAANDAFSEAVYKGKDLEAWKEFRRKYGEKDDPRITDTTGLYYYFYSIGTGTIGISTFNPIDEDKLLLLKRFRNVFNLSYQRYSDIALAEAQAREAKIEAALERVRSRTMGMQRSEELKDVIRVVYEQFVHLKISVDHAGFVIDYKPKGDWHFWIADEQDIPSKMTHPYFDSVWAKQFNEAKEKGADFFATNLNFEEKNNFYNQLLSYVSGLTEESKDFYLNCRGLAVSTVLLENVSLYIENFSGTPYSDEENKILMRFGIVFQQTYTRFLDLQKAEAQAREAQIESALEKIRSRSLAMQKSDELKEVITVVIKKLQELGMAMEGRVVGIYTFEENSKDHVEWVASPEFTSALSIRVPYFNHPVIDEFFEIHEKRGTLNKIYSRELKDSAFRVMYQLPELRDNPESEKQWVFGAEDYSLTVAFEDHSAVGIASFPSKLFAENDVAILKRFARVFEQSYIRFLDLKKAEAQAREAQIEAALERTRTQSMLMQYSNELDNTLRVFHKQILLLGIQSSFSFLWLPDEKKDRHIFWAAWGEKDSIDFSSKAIDYPLDRNEPATAQCLIDWKGKEPVVSYRVPPVGVESYFAAWQKLIAGVEQLRPEYFSDGLYYVEAFMKYGCFGVMVRSELSEEEKKILYRFTIEFERAYTRFLDLQKAEAQKKIIQAENERKTKELEDARQLQLSMLPKELPQLAHLDIAVYMKTATEVGGDYYDFNIDSNGTLTVVVGDATGHGMMSGMMVSIMKSFFISHKSNIELKQFFENANNSIKDMHLGRLMMSFMGVQITSQKLIATNAGMPSLIYFRNKSQKAGEFVSNNLPLGAMKETKYLLKEINYEKGDTLLLMSDGFAELKNEKNEQYSYPRIINEFRSVAQSSSNVIVDHLKNSASKWINGIEPDDDVTFVVIKIR
jgi:serine phosphatase RsbU (regulator of sigma subunit)